MEEDIFADFTANVKHKVRHEVVTKCAEWVEEDSDRLYMTYAERHAEEWLYEASEQSSAIMLLSKNERVSLVRDALDDIRAHKRLNNLSDALTNAGFDSVEQIRMFVAEAKRRAQVAQDSEKHGWPHKTLAEYTEDILARFLNRMEVPLVGENYGDALDVARLILGMQFDREET